MQDAYAKARATDISISKETALVAKIRNATPRSQTLAPLVSANGSSEKTCELMHGCLHRMPGGIVTKQETSSSRGSLPMTNPRTNSKHQNSYGCLLFSALLILDGHPT